MMRVSVSSMRPSASKAAAASLRQFAMADSSGCLGYGPSSMSDHITPAGGTAASKFWRNQPTASGLLGARDLKGGQAADTADAPGPRRGPTSGRAQRPLQHMT